MVEAILIWILITYIVMASIGILYGM